MALKLDSNQHISAYLRHFSEPIEILSDETDLLMTVEIRKTRRILLE